MRIYKRLIKKYVTSSGQCPFDEWFDKLDDIKTQAIVSNRLNRIIQGNFGDCKKITNRINELRINFGQGLRIYFFEEKKDIVILLCGGNKSTQVRDIKKAINYLEDYDA